MDAPNDDRIDRNAVEAIEALGDRRRLEILFALADREWERRTAGHAMSFTELYDEVDVDSTSQFAYHLKRLVGRFVTETSEGYRLTHAGDRIVRAVRSGLYESTPTFEAVDVDGACPFCRESELVADSHDERFVVRCAACDGTLLVDSFPRSQAANRSPSEVAESFGHRIWGSFVATRGGVCPVCYGRVDTSVDSHEREGRTFHTITGTCRACRIVIHFPIEVPVAFHPVAAAFLWRHGVSLFETPLWELLGHVTSDDWTTEVESTVPLAARFEITLDDETLVLAMDDALTVTPVPDEGDCAPRTDG